MTAPSDLEGLLARVEAATGGDREIDSLVFEWERPELKLRSDMRGSYYGEITGEYFHEGEVIAKAPTYTASLDAALSLVERVLPEWRWIVEGGGRGAATAVLLEPPEDDARAYDARSTTPPLALICALLKAKIADTAGPTRPNDRATDEPPRPDTAGRDQDGEDQ